MPEHFNTPQQLQEKLAEFLVKGALYRNFVYTGRNCHFQNSTPRSGSRYGKLPAQLKIFCDHKKCEQETL